MQIRVDLFISGAVGATWTEIDPDIINTSFIDIAYLESEGLKYAYEKDKGKSLSDQNETTSLSLVDENVRLRFWNVMRNHSYDYIIFSYVYYSPLLNEVPDKTIKLLLLEDFVSIQHLQAGDTNFSEHIEDEIFAVRRFDRILCISSTEFAFFSNFVDPRRIRYFPHFVKVVPAPIRKKDIDIFFFASENHHNQRGIHWFLEEIYPLIRDFRYRVVFAGKITRYIDKVSFPEITLIETVDSPAALYQRTHIAICPLLTGTGVKIKIVEAMSFGVPVVCTGHSLNGLPNRSKNGCLVADDQESFACAINSILTNPQLRKTLIHQGKAQYEQFFTWSSALATIQSALSVHAIRIIVQDEVKPEFARQMPKMRGEIQSLQMENNSLRGEIQSLQMENNSLRGEIQSLQMENNVQRLLVAFHRAIFFLVRRVRRGMGRQEKSKG
jgi:glycosyltransferase involved in cell wall biosynthesis